MIRLTRLDASVVFVNVEVILLVEETALAVVKLANGETIRVTETATEVARRVREARASTIRQALFGVASVEDEPPRDELGIEHGDRREAP